MFVNDVDARTTLGLEIPKPPARQTPAAGAAEQGEPPAEPPDGPPTTAHRDQSLAGLLDRGRILYGNALKYAEILAVLNGVGYDGARLQRELTDVTALGNADAVQEREKGEAIASTDDQRAALKEMKAWIARFRGIVVPALKDKPLFLMALGLKSRGGKR